MIIKNKIKTEIVSLSKTSNCNQTKGKHEALKSGEVFLEQVALESD